MFLYFIQQADGTFEFFSVSNAQNVFKNIKSGTYDTYPRPAFGNILSSGIKNSFNLTIPEMVVNDNTGKLHLYAAGRCITSCSNNGNCDTLSKKCRCLIGQGLSDCSGCSRGFFSANQASCTPYPGVGTFGQPDFPRLGN